MKVTSISYLYDPAGLDVVFSVPELPSVNPRRIFDPDDLKRFAGDVAAAAENVEGLKHVSIMNGRSVVDDRTDPFDGIFSAENVVRYELRRLWNEGKMIINCSGESVSVVFRTPARQLIADVFDEYISSWWIELTDRQSRRRESGDFGRYFCGLSIDSYIDEFDEYDDEIADRMIRAADDRLRSDALTWKQAVKDIDPLTYEVTDAITVSGGMYDRFINELTVAVAFRRKAMKDERNQFRQLIQGFHAGDIFQGNGKTWRIDYIGDLGVHVTRVTESGRPHRSGTSFMMSPWQFVDMEKTLIGGNK